MKQDFVEHHLIFDTGDDLDGTPTLRSGFHINVEHPFQASPHGAYFWWAQVMALRFSSGVLFSS
jgi:hypothetical protein